jgi:hypothetical protein
MTTEKATIEVFRIKEDWHPYPWRFTVTFKGVRHQYAGIPNQCETEEEATERARERAGWLEDGTHDDRYR